MIKFFSGIRNASTKKYLISAFTITIILTLFVSQTGYAARAKVEVMGKGDAGFVIQGGSLYYENPYNVFYNPAYVNDSKNWAIIEKGSSGGGVSAQGGFVSNFGMFSFGSYFNRDQALSGFYSNKDDMRPLEVVLGGDMGMMKWGAGATFGSYTKNNDEGQNELGLKLGASIANIEPFVNVLLSSIEKTLVAGSAVEAKGFGIMVGTRFKWGEWIPYAAYSGFNSKINGVIAGAEKSSAVFGMGRNTKVTEGTRLSYSLAYVRDMISNHNLLPINLSVENDPVTWITIRAGLEYHLMDRKVNVATGQFQTQADNASARFGATLYAGKAAFNWVVGYTNNADTMDGSGFSLSNGFFTASSLSYNW